jgi:hypothetical protein
MRKTGARKAVGAAAAAGTARTPGTAAVVAPTIEVLRMGTAAAAAPAFWVSAAVAARAAVFLGALLSRPPLEAWGCTSRIAASCFLLIRLEPAVAAKQTLAANTMRAVAASMRSMNFKMASSCA